jgi:Divergent InlB B-repeat domain
VTSSPTGVSCGTTCETSFGYGTEVTLTAEPATGSTFSGWSGAGCSGTGSCKVTMTALREVTATFGLEQGTQSAQPGSSTSVEMSSTPSAPSAPVLSKLALKPRRFERKSKISFSLSAAATVKLEVLKKVKQKNGKTKAVKVGTPPQISGKTGANTVSFNGKLKRGALAPGKYTLRATATAAGLNSKPLTTAFEILP